MVFPDIDLSLGQFLSGGSGEVSKRELVVDLGSKPISIYYSQPIVTLSVSELGSSLKPRLRHHIIGLDAFSPQIHTTKVCGRKRRMSCGFMFIFALSRIGWVVWPNLSRD